MKYSPNSKLDSNYKYINILKEVWPGVTKLQAILSRAGETIKPITLPRIDSQYCTKLLNNILSLETATQRKRALRV